MSVNYVHSDQVENLREWFTQLETTRRDEAVATLLAETVRHETAILICNGDQPILIYAMEVDDPEQAHAPPTRANTPSTPSTELSPEQPSKARRSMR